jgi:tetratricopeptide (TPR) repeat protein
LTGELRACRPGQRLLWRTATLLCVPAALLCKEQAICLPALLLLTEWFLRRRNRFAPSAPLPPKRPAFWLRRIGAFYLWVTLGVAGYLLLRWVSLEHHLVRDVPPAALDNPLSGATGAQRFWTPFKILAQYLLVAFWPGNLCCDYSFNSFPLASAPADLKTLAGLAATAVAGWACWRVSSPRRDTLRFVILFFAVSYALISNSFLVIGTILGERLFYLPSLPLCWLVVMTLADWYARLKQGGQLGQAGLRLAPSLAWVALLVLTARTAIRCGDWRDSETLFTTDLQTHPQSARLQLFVARDLIDRKEYDQALQHLEKSLAIYPEYANAQANVGLIYALAGDWATARKYYMLARRLLWENPSLQAQYERFRQFYEAGKRFPERELQEVRRAAATQPADVDLQLRLAELQAGMGYYRRGIETLSRLLEQGVTDRRVKFDLASLLIIDEQFDRAQALLVELLAEAPNDWKVHSQLAILLARTDPAASLRHAQRAVEIQPLLFETRMNLIQALVENERYEDALDRLRELRAMVPANEPALRLIERQIRIVQERL